MCSSPDLSLSSVQHLLHLQGCDFLRLLNMAYWIEVWPWKPVSYFIFLVRDFVGCCWREGLILISKILWEIHHFTLLHAPTTLLLSPCCLKQVICSYAEPMPNFIFCWLCISLWFLVNDQLDAQFFPMYLFQFSTCFKQPRAHHQENQLYQYNLWYMSLWK